jgi:hypothetical protein
MQNIKDSPETRVADIDALVSLECSKAELGKAIS